MSESAERAAAAAAAEVSAKYIADHEAQGA